MTNLQKIQLFYAYINKNMSYITLNVPKILFYFRNHGPLLKIHNIIN